MAETFCDEDDQNYYLAAFYDTSKIQAVLSNYNSSSSISPLLEFVELPVKTYGENTIGAFISFPPSWPGGQSVLACALDARWLPAVIGGRRTAIKMVYSDGLQSWITLGTCGTHGTRRISVTPDWATQLNPTIQESNRSVIHEIMSAIPPSRNARWEDDEGFIAPLVESVLSIMLTNGLASTGFNAIPQGILKGCTENRCTDTCNDGDGKWCNAIMPDGEFGYGGSVYDLPVGADISKMTRFQTRVNINGYAYHWRSTANALSCFVLGVYCLVAIFHIMFALKTGLSSQSWDTISEIVALAMQSRPTERLRNTCAGIVTTSVFENFVRVGKVGDCGEHLELLFEGDSEVDPVVLDAFYE
jgi:hypothetical protein